jgi:phytoene dehydrogenase-like protein
MSKKIIIIGAGISGLTAGIYLQMNNYQTEIFELHNIPGGVCTAWRKKDYIFDGCLQWLVGSSPETEFHLLWQEVNAFQGVTFVDGNENYKVVEDSQEFTLFYDQAKAKSEMMRVAPEDEKAIDSFLSDLERVSKIAPPIGKAPELFGFSDYLKLVLKFGNHLLFMRKLMRQTWENYIKKFSNEKLLKYIKTGVPYDNFSAFAALNSISWRMKKRAGYPIGGSLPIAKNIEKTYFAHGGKIHYNSRVVEILVKDNKAVGIELESGEKHFADIVVSAGDGYNTIYELLKGKYISPEIDSYYKDLEIFGPICQVSFGINYIFKEVPHTIVYLFDEGITIDPKTIINRIPFHIYSFDPTLAPEGKTVVTTLIKASDFEYWQNLRKNDHNQYNKEKERIAKVVSEKLEILFPGIKEKIEVTDVATPITYHRYTNNWRGSFEGWIITPKTINGMKKILPGLENFYMISQWVNPGGGLPAAIMSGRNVTQIICHKEKIPFIVKR